MQRLFASFIALATASPALAQDTDGTDPLGTSAPYAFIMDADTEQTLYCKRCDEALIPASMSKLMVYYLVFERLRDGRLSMDDQFRVSEHAWRTGGAGTDGSTMFLSVRSSVRVEDLLRGAIIQSGNDACITLAEGISGSEAAFAEEMTRRAQELGLTQSRFVNATGLDADGQRMSARDIARLSYLLITEFPEYYAMFAEPEFTWNGIRQRNRNPLLREIDGADGVKTGHLSVSGFGLSGSAVRDGERRIIVLQGLETEDDRRREAPRVMRAAFSDFVSVPLVSEGAEVASADVWLGKALSVPLLAEQTVESGMHVDTARRLTAAVHYRNPLIAPISAGEVVGELVFQAPGIDDIKVPVIAGESIEKRGLLGRALVGARGS